MKTRILPVDIVKKFKILLSRRTDVDYGDFDTIDAKDSEDSLRDAEAIIETIDQASFHHLLKETHATNKKAHQPFGRWALLS